MIHKITRIFFFQIYFVHRSSSERGIMINSFQLYFTSNLTGSGGNNFSIQQQVGLIVDDFSNHCPIRICFLMKPLLQCYNF